MQDCRVIIWTNDGTSNTWTSTVLNKFKDVVWHLSWSITGNILAVSGGDNKVENDIKTTYFQSCFPLVYMLTANGKIKWRAFVSGFYMFIFLDRKNRHIDYMDKFMLSNNMPMGCSLWWSMYFIFKLWILLLQVSLWKETLEGQWVCISDVKKGQGQVTDGPSQEVRNLWFYTVLPTLEHFVLLFIIDKDEEHQELCSQEFSKDSCWATGDKSAVSSYKKANQSSWLFSKHWLSGDMP